MTTQTATAPPAYRQRRLTRGWEPVQLIGRLRIAAAHDRTELPPTYLLIRLVFEWENHRTPIPDSYAGWLRHIFDTEASSGLL